MGTSLQWSLNGMWPRATFFLSAHYDSTLRPMATHAVIQTGGKQYLVAPGATYHVERLEGDAGATVNFGAPLLVFGDDGAATRVGTPTVAGVAVTGTIVRQGRDRKITVVKYRAKSRYRRKQGHRQHFTDVRITAIA